MDERALRWERLEALFAVAVELPPDRQSAFVERETASDQELRRQLLALLDHDRIGPGRIAHAIDAAATRALAPRDWTGRRFGAYRLTGLIGEGGMGAVYRAIRDDDQYSKEVAIKVVRHGSETTSVLGRFRQERQILASLDHPYVARLLDGGVTSDGLPYFVLELIEGIPITRYADQHALSVEARLRLFQKVCEAVQYAHAKLIVHRDLKPANILIAPEGVPRLLDFGIAKLLAHDNLQTGTTQAGTLLLTPDYASPEQVLGKPPTVATDIYSLGAVLYQLLTGCLPHRIESNTPSEIERAICTTPRVPSEVTELTTAPARRLRGDLDNIVLMALRNEPERRYQSVEQFSRDISSHLEGLPVIARADTLAYRTGKFVQRNKLAITAAIVVAMTLVGGIVTTTIQARRAERRFAEVRRLARTVLFDIHDQIVDVAGTTKARQTIARTALEYLSSLSADARNDPTLQAELAEAYRRVGDVQGNPNGASLGDAAGALESYRRSVELYSSAARARNEDTRLQTAFAAALIHLGDRQRASANRPGARQSYSAAGRILDGVLAGNASEPTALESAAAISVNNSQMLEEDNDYAGALVAATKAVEIGRRLVGTDPGNPGWRDALGDDLSQLGSCLARHGELEKSADAYREGVAIRERLVQEDPGNANQRRSLMMALSHVGEVLGLPGFLNLGDTAGATVQFEKMLQIAEALSASDPSDRTAEMDLAQSLMRMGGVLEAEQPKAALPHFQRALEILVRQAAADPHTVAIESSRANVEGEIGAILSTLGNHREGIVLLRSSLARYQALAENSARIGYQTALQSVASDLAMALGRTGNRAGLEALRAQVTPSLDRLRDTRVSGFTAARRPRTLLAFGQAYALLGDRSEACTLFRQSADAWREVESAPGGVAAVHRAERAATVRESTSCATGKR